ncbi:hypothetical protein HNR77_005207 [Paenibacillus sp. JGP012]|nr:hypothetical protein [Paenibacillus sp. JGP012]
MTGAPVIELEYKTDETVILHILEEADMVTYLRIWVVPRVFNLVPETLVLGMGFFGFSEL